MIKQSDAYYKKKIEEERFLEKLSKQMTANAESYHSLNQGAKIEVDLLILGMEGWDIKIIKDKTEKHDCEKNFKSPKTQRFLKEKMNISWSDKSLSNSCSYTIRI